MGVGWGGGMGVSDSNFSIEVLCLHLNIPPSFFKGRSGGFPVVLTWTGKIKDSCS